MQQRGLQNWNLHGLGFIYYLLMVASPSFEMNWCTHMVSPRSSSDSTRLYLDIFQMCIGHFLLCSLHKPMIGTSKNDANFITAVHTALNSFQNIICTLNYLLIIIMDQLVKLILPQVWLFLIFQSQNQVMLYYLIVKMILIHKRTSEYLGLIFFRLRPSSLSLSYGTTYAKRYYYLWFPRY